jgi:hypothetical protein
MGLKDLFSRWSKGEDARAVERAEEESRMTPFERDVDQEDFEGRKDDLFATERESAGAESFPAAEDLED